MVFDSELTHLEERFLQLCQREVAECGLELYDVVYLSPNNELRVYLINRETGTVDIEDCIRVDRALTDYLDEEWVPSGLTLEVSSPGLYRVLKTKEHFKLAQGEQIAIDLKRDISDFIESSSSIKGLKKRKLKGHLVEMGEEEIKINLKDQILKIKYVDIKKANVEPVLDFNG